jgi:hypothetical protein
MSSLIIGVIVFGAFARAAGDYSKNAFLWGLTGLAAFFIPQYLISVLGTFILISAGAPGALSLFLIADFVLSVIITAWVYNKLMDRAIREMAARDAAADKAKSAVSNS